MKEKWTAFFEKIKGVFVAHKAVSVAVSCAAALVICTGAVTAVLLNRPADSLVDTSTSLSESDKELTVDESELNSALSVEEGTEVSTITNEDGTTEVASNNAEGTPSVSTPQSSTSTSTAAPSTTTPSTTPSTSTPSTPESNQPTTQEPTPTPTPTPEPEPEPEPEYPPFDANTVINNAIPRIKQFMTYMPEYAQELIQKGELTQEEYDKWGPSGGMGYFTFTFRLDETMEEIEQGLVDLYRQEHELYGNDYFYIEYAGVMHDGETYKGVTYIGSRPGHWFFLYRG